MAHQSRTIELRNWFVDGDCDLDLNPCYVIGHLMGEDATFYGDDVHVVKRRHSTTAKKLKPSPSTSTRKLSQKPTPTAN